MRLQEAKAILTPQQMLAAELLVENEFTGRTRTKEEIAGEVGVSRQSLYNWEQMPAFAAYMGSESDQRLSTQRAFTYSQLLKAIGGGNNGMPSIKAIELFMKREGLLTDKIEMTTNSQPQLSQAEISAGIEDLADRLREKED